MIERQEHKRGKGCYFLLKHIFEMNFVQRKVWSTVYLFAKKLIGRNTFYVPNHHQNVRR